MIMKILLVLVVCLYWSLLAEAIPQIVQVHVITRHGARYPLTKRPHTLAEGTPGTLTDTGVRQMYDLGVWLHYRYSNLLSTYNPSRVWLESSQFDRTVVSGNAIAAGIFRGESTLPVVNVPVYTMKDKNDVTIHSYDNCGAFVKYVNQLYSTASWIEEETNYKDLLFRLAEIPNFDEYVDAEGKIPLKELWNVYDAIIVAKAECGVNETSTTSCLGLADANVKDVLNESEWQDLGDLVRFTETARYNNQVAGRLVGNNLLYRIVQRMKLHDVNGTKPQDGGASFHLYSGHYPNLLSLVAALGQGAVNDEVIPDYGSAMIFELHQDNETSTKSVQIYYREGYAVEGLVNNTVYELDAACGGNSDCTLDTFYQLLAGWNNASWCKECNNSIADVCLVPASSSSSSSNNQEEQGNDSTNKSLPLALGLGFVGLVVGALAMWLFSSRQRAEAESRTEPSVEENNKAGNEAIPAPDETSVAEGETVSVS